MSRRLSHVLFSSWRSAFSAKVVSLQLIPERAFSLSTVQNTWVLKRQKQLPVTSLTGKRRRALRMNEQVYDVVACTHEEPSPPLQLLLRQDVPGHGKAGDIVTVRRNIARMFLLPEGKAEYVTPQGIAAFEAKKLELALHPERQSSSATAATTVEYLGNMILNVPMNMHNPWRVERWHIRMALRRQGVWCPSDDVIELPMQEIVGPHSDMHGRCFSVFVTINGKERGCVLCRIELLCKDPADALPSLDKTNGKPVVFQAVFPGAVSDHNQPPTILPRPKTAVRQPRPFLVKDF